LKAGYYQWMRQGSIGNGGGDIQGLPEMEDKRKDHGTVMT